MVVIRIGGAHYIDTIQCVIICQVVHVLVDSSMDDIRIDTLRLRIEHNAYQVLKNFSIVTTFLTLSCGASFSLGRGKALLASGRGSPDLTKSQR